jgi:hypothetical protein
MGLRPTQGDEKSLRPATTLYRTVAPSFVIPSEAEGSAVPRTFRGHVFRQSAAERRDLCVEASSWKCFSTERTRISYLTALTGDHACGSPLREPHAVDRSRNSRQEIRGSRGICSSTDFSWKCFSTPTGKSGETRDPRAFPGNVFRQRVVLLSRLGRGSIRIGQQQIPDTNG